MEQIEKGLKPVVSALLRQKGYDLVIPYPPNHGRLSGRGEFGIEVPGPETRRCRRVDVVAARWDGDWDIKAVAVECKASVWAVYDGLGQAVQYQSLFDEVYVATPATPESAEDSIARATLADLGLGHTRVEQWTESAYVEVPPQAQRPSRFQPYRKATHITPRLTLGLAFLEVAERERRVRYGFYDRGLGAWYAEEVVGHLQWNCGHSCWQDGDEADQTWMGINVEHVADTRRICSALSSKERRERLESALHNLPSEYQTVLRYAPILARPGDEDDVRHREPARSTSADEVLRHLKGAGKNQKPQLGLGLRFGREEWQKFSRSDYLDQLRKVREDLAPVMGVLKACYE